jgi:hypothetical protein
MRADDNGDIHQQSVQSGFYHSCKLVQLSALSTVQATVPTPNRIRALTELGT